MVQRALTLFLSFTLCLTAVSADVLIVDETGATAGSFTTIQSAIDAAVSGDTVLITGSGLEAFQESLVISSKGITLVPDTGVTVLVKSIEITDVPTNDRMVIRRINAGAFFGLFADDVALTASNCAGALHIEDCDFVGQHGSAGIVFVEFGFDGASAGRLEACDNLVIHQCSFIGGLGGTLEDEDKQSFVTSGGSGLEIISSNAHISATTMDGNDGGDVNDTVTSPGGNGGHGLVITDSTVSVTGGHAQGADGGHGDCDVFGCGSGGPGGDGIRQTNNQGILHLRDAMPRGGFGGTDGDGQGSAPDGIAVNHAGAVLLNYASGYRDFTTTSPLRSGDTLTLSFDGLAGDTALFWASLNSQVAFLPQFQGPFLLANPVIGPTPFVAGNFAADGTLNIPVAIPSLTGFDALDVSLQMFTQEAGGSVVFGSGSTITLIGD